MGRFPDVPQGHWSHDAIERLGEDGIVSGYEDGEFKGDRQVTRYELAAIADRILEATMARLIGQVTDASTGQPTPAATIAVAGPQTKQATPDSQGLYKLRLKAGAYQAVFSAAGFDQQMRQVMIAAGQDVRLDVALQPSAAPPPPPTTGSIGGKVTDAATGAGIPAAAVTGSGPQPWGVQADINGIYASPARPVGELYDVTATAQGYTPQTKQGVV